MFGINRISIIEEYRTLAEEQDSLEEELFQKQASIIDRDATYEELKEEVEYRKKISDCEYKKECLRDEFKSFMIINLAIRVVMWAAVAIVLATTIKCSKDEKATEKISVAPIVRTDEEGNKKYYAPAGYMLAYDENGKPYCYQEKSKTLVKSNY